MLKKVSFFIALFLTIAIIVGSLLPLTNVSGVVSVNDKLVHNVAYMVITFFWLLASPLFFVPKKKGIILVSVFIMGIIIEILQGTLTKNREAEILDILANIGGILMAYTLFTLFFKKNHNVCKNNL